MVSGYLPPQRVERPANYAGHNSSPLVLPHRASLNSRRHGQFLFDVHLRNECDFELKGACDEARFFGLFKYEDSPVTIFFFQNCDDRPQFDFRKTPATILFAEHAFRVQVEGRKSQAGLLRNAREGAGETACHSGDEEVFRCPAPWLPQELRWGAERYTSQDSFRVDDAIASARGECVDSIFMVSSHFLLLSSSQREIAADSGLAFSNANLTRGPVRSCDLGHH